MEGVDNTKDKDGDVLGHLAGFGNSVAGSFSVFRDRVRCVFVCFSTPNTALHPILAISQGRIFFNRCQDGWQRLRRSCVLY